jgi:hypothetical protein
MSESNSSKPLFVYTIVEGKETDKKFFVKIGVAFVNRDSSINVKLDALPVNGQLHIREQQDRDEEPPAAPPTTKVSVVKPSAGRRSY